MEGVVLVPTGKNFGFVKADDGTKTFVPPGAYKDMADGDRIQFDKVDNPKGPRASSIKLVSKRTPTPVAVSSVVIVESKSSAKPAGAKDTETDILPNLKTSPARHPDTAGFFAVTVFTAKKGKRANRKFVIESDQSDLLVCQVGKNDNEFVGLLPVTGNRYVPAVTGIYLLCISFRTQQTRVTVTLDNHISKSTFYLVR